MPLTISKTYQISRRHILLWTRVRDKDCVMGYLNEAHFYAQLGLKEAKKQDNHFCDMEFNDVLIRLQAMSRMTTTPISKGNTNNEESENTDSEK